MSYWAQMSCEASTINETIFYCPLGHGHFRYFSPKFSSGSLPIEFLAVFDGYAQSGDGTDYEFILGNEAGSGAFTFPNPKLILPFSRVDDTNEPNLNTAVKTSPAGFNNPALSLHGAEPIPRDMLQEGQACNKWLEKVRHIRPYHGFYGGGVTHDAVLSSHADMVGLKDVMGLFDEPLLDEQLPAGFREGVSYIVSEDADAICRKFGIPIIDPP